MDRPGPHPTPESQGCRRYAVVGDPDSLCAQHRNNVEHGRTTFLIDGRTLPERVPGAEVVHFPTPPGMLDNPLAVPADILPVMPIRADHLQELLLRGVDRGLSRALQLIEDPGTTDYKMLKATEVILRFARNSGLMEKVQESLEERDLDEEILAAARAVTGEALTAPPVAEQDREAQIIALAEAEGYEIEFVDDKQEVG